MTLTMEDPFAAFPELAAYDYRFFQKAKDQAGLSFIIRPKSNSNLTRTGFNHIAPTPVNEGVTSDEPVAPTSTGRIFRRTTWTDPDSGESWQSLTNGIKHSPGLIVLLYRRRWDLENVYVRWLRRFLWQTRPLDEIQRILIKRYATL